MTANEIYLRLKSLFVDTALPKIRKFVGAVGNQMSKAGKAVAGVTSMFGEMEGKMGKVVGAAGRVCTAIMALGPVGGVIAGATALWELFTAKAKESLEAFQKAAQRLAQQANAAMERVKRSIHEALNKSLEESTVKAKRATQAFDALADAYLKVAGAKDATAEAGDDAEMAALRQQKAEAVSRAGEGPEAAVIGAEYDVKIAERAAKATAEAHDRAVKKADEEAAIAANHALHVQSEESKARKALNDALKKEAEARKNITPNDGGKWEREMQEARKRAEAALVAAQQARIAAEANVAAAAEKVKQAQLAQAAALADASASVTSARSSLGKLVKARDDAAKAELEAAEKAAQKAARDAERKELNRDAKFHRQFIQGEEGRIAESAEKLRAAENAKASAWAMYKSPEAMRAQLQEEKNEARARRRFEADAERLQRRSDWRTARLGRRDEATRRMLLAKEEADVRKKELDGMRRQVADSKRALEKIAATLEQEVAL